MSDITKCPGRTDGAYEVASECRDCLRRTLPVGYQQAWISPRDEPCPYRMSPAGPTMLINATVPAKEE